MSTDIVDLIESQRELVAREPEFGPVTESSWNETRHLFLVGFGFVVLLALALAWPAPVVLLNRWTFDLPLSIDQRSFLGREAPSWDVAYWMLAGMFALWLFDGRIERSRFLVRRLVREISSVPVRVAARWKDLSGPKVASFVLVLGVAVMVTWLFLDSRIVALATGIRQPTLEPLTSWMNRLGGGSNPAMIVLFFGLAGIACLRLRWSILAVAMTIAGASGGLAINLVKLLVRRARPELWLGPFEQIGMSVASFPSGHTFSAFVVGGVLFFGSRSAWLRGAAIILATLVGTARVLAFRHWPSDVLASALVGLVLAWFFTTALLRETPSQS
ncbi:MAG TPA: phosphatase PAP2 family protein [Thermoanaerobaculia bacterium]|nr:phosphatase PAP2 family protein [Thermoanaerobaculia bacterium]